MLQRSVALNLEKMGPDAPQTASSRRGLGKAYLRAGKPDKARAELAEAVRGLETSQGANSGMLTDPLRRLAEVEVALHNDAAALADYKRALDVLSPDATNDIKRKEINDAIRAIQTRGPSTKRAESPHP